MKKPNKSFVVILLIQILFFWAIIWWINSFKILPDEFFDVFKPKNDKSEHFSEPIKMDTTQPISVYSTGMIVSSDAVAVRRWTPSFAVSGDSVISYSNDDEWIMTRRRR